MKFTDREKIIAYIVHTKYTNPKWSPDLLTEHCIAFSKYFTPSIKEDELLEIFLLISSSFKEAAEIIKDYGTVMKKKEWDSI